jgi:alanine-glyoxylate transaminase/serine-glyoxylate transaminase/serine-pyruvate transaminase
MNPGELLLPRRVLLGPGPSDVNPRVLRALSTPLVGHLDPEFIALMEGLKELLRATFATRNRLTLPLSATGSAGMEAVLVNLLEPGDAVIVGVNGVFGGRMAEVARRAGAEVTPVEVPWGSVIEPDAVRRALAATRAPRLVALVHAETSTGALQPLAEIGRLAHEHGALFAVDAVTSLGGCELRVDDWGIDACYSATQKCLSCPPGLAPVTFGEAAVERIRERRTTVQSWYLDLRLIEQYWGEARVYHHTAPISMNYALYEALRIVHEEGLERRWLRHTRNHLALVAGLGRLGLSLAVPEDRRLPPLTSVLVPEGVDEASVRRFLLERHSIEVGAGLGPWKGKVLRIGLMGESSCAANVLLLLAALGEAVGRRTEIGAALGAAEEVLAS